MQVSDVSSVDAAAVGSMRDGVLEQKFLLTGEDGSPNNYVLNVGRAGAGGWSTPRHRHNFDQIRYVIKGNYPYSKGKAMQEGWVGYFPESVYYGPQDRPEGLETMVCQLGGASGSGFLSIARREAANEALKSKGEFKNGVFTYTDENGQRHNKDGSAACFEEATGQELVFAKPRYEDVILMDPSSYAWIPDCAAGVYVKWLGSFTERNMRLGFVRMEPGAVFAGGEQPSIEVLFQTKGTVSLGDKIYGRHAAFEFLANEGPIPLRAEEECEFLRIVMHQF